jgi:deoxyribonuclease V
MIAAFDVQYDDARSVATAAAVVFAQWTDAVPTGECTTLIQNIQPYIPGEFFRRELPCLITVIAQIRERLDLLIVDGYVTLDGKPGLGQHLFDHFAQRIPVIGVAKTRFHTAPAVEVFRGVSRSPLHITAIGIDPAQAANHIQQMHGPHRIPTLLKRVDQLARM